MSLFYWYQGKHLHLAVADALGTLFSFRVSVQNPLAYLYSWLYFINSSLMQLQTLQDTAADTLTLHLYELKTTPDCWQLCPKTLPKTALEAQEGLQVLVNASAEGQKSYQFFPVLAPQVALAGAHLAEAAAQGFIQDLIFAQPSPRVQLMDFIKARHKIEKTVLLVNGGVNC